MEVMNPMPSEKPDKDVMRSRNIFLGLTFIVIGLLWLFNNLDMIPNSVFDVLISWQMLLVVIGGFLLSQEKWVAGGIITVLGVFFVASDLFGLDIPVKKVILPVVFIAAGISIVLSRIDGRKF